MKTADRNRLTDGPRFDLLDYPEAEPELVSWSFSPGRIPMISILASGAITLTRSGDSHALKYKFYTINLAIK